MTGKIGLYAGGDWSGKPGKPSGAIDIFAFALAAFPDLEVLNTQALALRHELGMPLDEEFHGHEMSDAMNAAVLGMGLRLEMRVGVLLVNKSAVPLGGAVVLPSPARFTHEIGVRLIERFVARDPLRRVWLDEDIKGKAAQGSFKTAVQRAHRAYHPASTCGVVFKRSHASVMIQLADVVAYVLSRQARGARFEPVLENAVRKLRLSERHLILGPLPWED